MHADLVAISNLWSPDSTLDHLRAELDALQGGVAKAEHALADAEAALAAASAALDALVQRDRANGRELDSYVQKRDTTRKMIEQGTAPDYAAAERQLAACVAKVDELETAGIELLDQLDTARAARKAAERAVADAVLARDEARAALAAREGDLREEAAAASKKRQAAWAELPHDLKSPYEDLRRKRRPALVNTAEGVCTACHTHVGQQRIAEVALGRAVHRCPGCGAWVLP